ncbi:MAG: hypothetical protein WDN29_10775 [Methylovirgula sp.]
MTFYHWTTPKMLALIEKEGLRPFPAKEWELSKASFVWLTTNPDFETGMLKAYRTDAERKENLLGSRFPFHTPVRVTVNIGVNSSRLKQANRFLNQPILPSSWYAYEGSISQDKIHSAILILPPGVKGDEQPLASYMDRVERIEKKLFPEYYPAAEDANEGDHS